MNWIQSNWEHVLIYCGLAVGIWNGIIAFLKVMGYPQLAAWCQKLEDAISAAVKAFMDSKKPPQVGGGAVAVIIVALMASSAFAETVSVGDVLTKAGAKEGILLDVKSGHGLNFLAATIAQKGQLSLVGGIVSTDGIGLAADCNIGGMLPETNFPILQLFDYLHVGVGGYYRTLTVHTDPVDNSKAEDKWGWGPVAFLKWKF